MMIKTECNLAEIVFEFLNGKTIVFPTETSYGLGCDATNQEAVDKIFKIKGRKSDKPLLVVVPNVEMAKKYLVWNDTLEKIASKYWPGPVTVVGEYKQHGNLPLTLSFADGRGAITPSPLQRRGQGEVSLARRNFSFERIAGFIKNLPRRRDLRQNATKAEKVLWSDLRNKRLGGLKFYRQHGIGPFIVDFYHPETRTIIEIDGDVHFAVDKQEKKDREREDWLKERGYIILRYNNVDIFGNLQWVLEEIYHELTRPLPNTPLCGGEGSRLAGGVVSKDGTVAVRVTAYPLLKSITEKLGRPARNAAHSVAGGPLVATSANLSDTGDMYNVADIVKQFKGKKDQPDIVLDYGELPRQTPTTIVSVVGGKPAILRQGKVEIV